MPNRLILKVTKFQLPPAKRLGTVVKNILGAIISPPPMSNRVNGWEAFNYIFLDQKFPSGIKLLGKIRGNMHFETIFQLMTHF